MNILPKKLSENGQCYCTALKCKIVYDDIVFNQTCIEINAEEQDMQIQSTVFVLPMQLLVTDFTTKILIY